MKFTVSRRDSRVINYVIEPGDLVGIVDAHTNEILGELIEFPYSREVRVLWTDRETDVYWAVFENGDVLVRYPAFHFLTVYAGDTLTLRETG